MRSWFLWVAILVLVFGFVAAWILVHARGSHEEEQPEPRLEAVRVEPPPEAGEEIECAPFARVHFLYLLRNNGTEPIRGLKLGLGCRCEAAEQPPEEIAPGATAQIGFRLSAGDAGRVRRRVELVVPETGEVVSTLDVALRTKFEPPALTRPLQSTRVTFVDGEDTPLRLVFESIEKRDSPPWIDRLTVEPDSLLEITSLPVEESPHVDPSLTRRVYPFLLSRGHLAVGRHSGLFHLRTRCEPPAMPTALPLAVEVLDQVAIIPKSVSIGPVSGKLKPVRILVVRRVGSGAVDAAQWDRQLLDVRRVGDEGERAAAFTVVPRSLPDSRQETTIVLDVGGGETREIPVEILPAREPSRPL